MRSLLRYGIAVLLERSYVVEHPKASAMRGNNQVAILHNKIVHRGQRQIQLQRLPLPSVIERNEHASFRAAKKQAVMPGIDAHGMNIRIRGKTVHKLGPSFTEIGGLKNVRREVVHLVAFDGDGR